MLWEDHSVWGWFCEDQILSGKSHPASQVLKRKQWRLTFWNERGSSKRPLPLERQYDVNTEGNDGVCITIIIGLNCLSEIVLLSKRDIRLRTKLFLQILSLEKFGSWGLKRHSEGFWQVPQRVDSLHPNLHRESTCALAVWPCEKLGGTTFVITLFRKDQTIVYSWHQRFFLGAPSNQTRS